MRGKKATANAEAQRTLSIAEKMMMRFKSLIPRCLRRGTEIGESKGA